MEVALLAVRYAYARGQENREIFHPASRLVALQKILSRCMFL
jgi:hypothetical protein